MSEPATRRAGTDDADSIAAVHVATWRTAYASLLPRAVLDAQSESVRAAFWSSYLEGENWPVFVAQDASGITGFASCIPCRDRDIAVPTVAELAALYELDDARVHDERLEADEVRMRVDLSTTRSCTR